MRVATALDVHAFAIEPRPLMLACLEFSPTGGLAGHSDADVAAHAAADALLIASGIGELGTIFGTDRPEWAGAPGAALLGEAVRLVLADGWQVANISIQIIGQKPRFAPRKIEAQDVMGRLVGAPVMIAATTTDHLGALGRVEGIGALATVLLTR